MTKLLPSAAIFFATSLTLCRAAEREVSDTGALVISADKMAADNVTATVVASGNVCAVSHPFKVLSDFAEKKGDDYRFAPDTCVTTCTNDHSCLHWAGSGEVKFYGKEGSRYAVARNMTLRAFGLPVMWFPYWYYPLDTDYGWRVMPGYTSRWGAYLLTKYVYHLYGEHSPETVGLSASTRFDVRAENGIALGQGLNWSLGQFGQGHFKVYYAWDRDADRYDRHWVSNDRYNYQNWGSEVPDERYALSFAHRWTPTERDTVRVGAEYLSDSHFNRDFLRDALFGHSNRFIGYSGNEITWEHIENVASFGATVTGPVNDFHGGVARLPEFYFDLAPQPIFMLPANYESSSRAGFMNRNYAKYGSDSTAIPFRYVPGEWADYQTFRFDTYHRVTAPFKIADALSVVPRVGVRATFWERVGDENLTGLGRASTTDANTWRFIYEGGVTFAMRGQADFGDGMNHLIEPYADVLVQEADYHGLDKGKRPLIFDSHDASSDWLDQFAGRSRNLPYSWYGVTPGVRNAIREADEDGHLRTIFDLDLYAAIQFNDTEWTTRDGKHRLAKNPDEPNYGENGATLMPGFRARWLPSKETMFSVRGEFDTDREVLAYADLAWNQIYTKNLRSRFAFIHRNQNWWDFAPAPYDSALMSRDDFNEIRFSYAQVSVEHEISDRFAWGPFISWDLRDEELDEVGTWFDVRTDCLGFRFLVSYENKYERIDRSKVDEDWRFGFYVYLRALGAQNGSPF